MTGKLVLIDGHSILNRAFFGIPELTNAKGFHTNAIYGFLNIMFRILEEEKPEYLVVAFDVSAPTFRHLIYKEYKGTRKPMAEELREQVPVMKELLRAMGVTVLEQAGLEADDILGTMAKRAEQEGLQVSLVSGDRDLLQIASDKIKIRIPKTKPGKTEIEDYYAKDVKERYQVTPLQFIELKALMGDTADNIPGVPKVGEKTATDLMVTYGSISAIYAHLEEISKKSIKESLREHQDLADLSLTLATIKTDCDISCNMEEANVGELFTSEAYPLFKELEFKNMLSRFSKDNMANNMQKTEQISCTIQEVSTQGEMDDLTAQIILCDKIAILPLVQKTTTAIAVALNAEKIFLLNNQSWSNEGLTQFLRQIYQSNTVMVTYAVKELYSCLMLEHMPGQLTDEVVKHFHDILLAAYLLNPLKNDYHIDDISNQYLNQTIATYEQVFGKLTYIEAMQEQPEEWKQFVAKQVQITFLSDDVLYQKLNEEEMLELQEQVEMPLSYVLYRMEREGVCVDANALKCYGDELASEISRLEKSIYQDAGREFNLNSPKQLGELLFDEMKIPGGKKTKTGYSTSADILEKLAPDYPMIQNILEYRTYAKLKSTYADGLAVFIENDGRIHTNFNQTITATGRISSTEPNLQNIPMRIELGRRIRKVFIPKKDHVFIDADYSQIELRILASLAQDDELIEAYRTNEDIHTITASKVFHIPMEEVTSQQRRDAKAVNFGIVYGISSFGLSQGLSISKKLAQQYIDEYFETYPQIKKYLEQAKEEAKANGYSVTYFKRRRPIPELKSSNYMQRSFGERVAMNAPIQGTAADVMKIAMIRVYDRLISEGLQSRMLLQVHDELLIETRVGEEAKVMAILKEEMQGAADFPVQLLIDAHTGNDWYEAK